MDGEEFFDRLYSQFYLHFPCYALLDEKGSLAAEPAEDGTLSLTLMTDDDLIRRYNDERAAGRHFPVMLLDAGCLKRFLSEIPSAFTHVTFDPNPRVHRRYPVGVLRESLATADHEG